MRTDRPNASVPAPAAGRTVPYRICASWLGGEQADRLLAYAIEAQARFKPTKVLFAGESKSRVEESERRSVLLTDLGPFTELLQDKAQSLQNDLEMVFGMGHVPTTEIEMEMVAHGDGGFYHPHIDSFTNSVATKGANRRLSLVYYFHRLPRRFTGGRLRLLGLGNAEPVAIEPTRDSLLAFPSFLPHEVEKVSGVGGSFADCRFSVNIWLCG